MKQVIVHAGEVRVVEVPAPQPSARGILVRVEFSCISTGTEVAGIRAAAQPLLQQAIRQPQKIRRAIEMIRNEGLGRTLERALGQTQARPLGYSLAGVVEAVGKEVDYFAPGDRVACAGSSLANHAQWVDIPVNLAVKIPQRVEADAASTVALGAIAMQGVRRAAPQLGESFVVVGLGLIGQITVQLLRANACRVLAVDPDAGRVAVARAGGIDASLAAQDYAQRIASYTDGLGADGVIITAASSDPQLVNTAAQACRVKGRVVIVGDVRLDLDRTQLYQRELDLLIATSYGPGRYDPSYESDGIDYPPAYVRWTENRNMQAYLQLLASGAIRLDHLTRSVTPLENATQAYGALNQDEERPLLALLTYPKPDAVPASAVTTIVGSPTARSKQLRVALIGAGSFAQSMHIPNLERLRDRYALHAVVGRTGATVELIARRHGAKYATTQFERVLEDRDVDVVLIATRHNLHASMVLQALAAGKHVLVEKPLAITADELSSIERYFSQNTVTPLLLTGYNRRFAPALEAARTLIQQRATPLVVNYRMNAGYLPLDHWVHGPEGGGRNIGEACHVYDLFGFLTDSAPLRVQAEAISPRGRELRRDDNFVATIRYEDGSLSTLTYTALGASEYPKEKMEIYADGTVLSLEDYRRLDVSGRAGPVWSSSSADKGHLAMLAAFADGVRQMRWPVALQRQLDAMRIAFQVQDAIHS